MEIDRIFWLDSILPVLCVLAVLLFVGLFIGHESKNPNRVFNFLSIPCGLCIAYIVGVFAMTDALVPFYSNNQLNKRGIPATAVCESAGCSSEGGCGGTYYYYIENKKYSGEYTGTWFYKDDTFPILYLKDKPGISYPKAGLNGSYY